MRTHTKVLLVLGLLVVSSWSLFLLPAGNARTMDPLWSYAASGTVYSVSISEDGNFIVAGTGDGKIHLFSGASSTPLWSFTTGGEVHSVSISADGSYIVAGSLDNKVYLFESGSSTPVWTYSTGNSVLSVDISYDGNYVVAGSADFKVYLFGVGSLAPIWSKSVSAPVKSVSISAAGDLIAAGANAQVHLFRRASPTPLWSYMTGFGVSWVEISLTGGTVTATDDGDRVFLFNMTSSTPSWTFSAPDYVSMVSLSGTGEYIAAACDDYKIYLFHRSSSTPLWSYSTGHWADAVDLSDDGSYLAGGSANNKAYFFSTQNMQPMWDGQGGGVVRSVSVTSRGEYVAVAGGWTVKLFPGDDLPPEISNVSAIPQPQSAPGFINISADVIDDAARVHVFVNITYPDLSCENVSMNESYGSTRSSNRTYDQVGSYDFTIWASDPAGNFNFSTGSFSLVGGPPSAPPTDLQASLQGPNSENVRITWTLSADDGAGKGDVVSYDIYRRGVFNASGAGYSLYDSVPNGTAEYVDLGAGEGNPSNFFYRVCSINTNSSLGCSPSQVGKFTRPLAKGLNLVSIPLIQSNESVERVLQTVRFDRVWTYHSSDSMDPWKCYVKSKPYKGDLRTINHTMGVWISVITDSNVTVAGIVPLTTSMQLWSGWNLIGFPSFNPTYLVSDLKAETGATRVEGLDPSAIPHCLRVLNDVDTLQAGGGYWLKVETGTLWVVSNG